MYVWGRNHNHLFRQNHKKTYSLPQKVPLNQSISKCAAGYDYILILTKPSGRLICYYQSALYQINNFSNVIDVSTTDNIIVIITQEGTAWIMEFNPQKIINGELSPSKITLQERSCRVFMNYGDIFLQTTSHSIYHLRRNQWYQTKTYSDPSKVNGLEQKIISIAPGLTHTYFLTQTGKLFMSETNNPTETFSTNVKLKFKAIAAAQYFMGIAENGRLYIWGRYNQHTYENPTEFGKIAQSFRSVQMSSENGFAITQTGQGWIWGKNANGELGISDYEPRPKPFPLITMEKQKIKDIYIGDNYTVCTVQTKHPIQSFNSFALKNIINNADQSDHVQKKRMTKARVDSKDKLNCSEFVISQKHQKTSNMEQYALKILKLQEKCSKNNDENAKSIFPESVRQQSSHKKMKFNDKPPQLITEKVSYRSRSPLSSFSQSKSPLSKSLKSPPLQNIKTNSFSNIQKKKALPINNDARVNTSISFQSYFQELEQENANLRKLIETKQTITSAKIRELQQENELFKRALEKKESVIDDITRKISLLQEAIEQHERSLTSRESTMQEYQRRQKEYQIHIDQLEKNIEVLIRGTNYSQTKEEDFFNDMYKNLKVQFAKEKDFFMKKMTEYQNLLKHQRHNYKQKIKTLQEEVSSYKSTSNNESQVHSSRTQRSKTGVEKQNKKVLQKQNQKGSQKQHKKGSQKQNKTISNQAHNFSNALQQKNIKMNFIISRIENSKVRIAKSATKLYEMMQQRQ